MAASKDDETRISPLLKALLFVSEELTKEDVKNLTFLLRDIVPESQLDSVTKGHQLFTILMKLQKITERDFSIVCELLEVIHRVELKEKFLQRMRPAGDQPPQSRPFGSVCPQGDRKTPQDFTRTEPPAAVTQTGIFAGIPKPAKRLSNPSTGTRDSTAENISDCGQSLNKAYTLPKSATNKFSGQSLHTPKTFSGSSVSKGSASSINGSPELKAVCTPRTTANDVQLLHANKTLPGSRRFSAGQTSSTSSEGQTSSTGRDSEIKAVSDVYGTLRTTTSAGQSLHTSKTSPSSLTITEGPPSTIENSSVTKVTCHDDTPGATPRSGRSLYPSETFPRSFKTSGSTGPASSINSSLGTEAVCTPGTSTSDVQSLNASQTVPRSATRSRSCGSASSIDGSPKMTAVCTPSTTASNGQLLHTSKTLPRSRSASEGQASSTDRCSKMKAVCDVYGTLRTTTKAGQSLHTSKTSPSSLTIMEGPPSAVEPSSATEAMCDVDDTLGATARNDQSVYTSETFPRSFKTSVSTGPASSFNNSLESEAACTPRTPTSDAQSLCASQTVPRLATRSHSCGSTSSSDGRPEMKAVCIPSTTASNAGSLHTSKTIPRSRSASEGQASSTDTCSEIKAVCDVYGTLRTTTKAGRSLHTSKTSPSSLTIMEEPSSTIENSSVMEAMHHDDTPGATPRNGLSPHAFETFPRSVNRSASNGPASSSNSSLGTEPVCTSRTPSSDVQSSYASQTVPRSATRSSSCGSASSSDGSLGMKAVYNVDGTPHTAEDNPSAPPNLESSLHQGQGSVPGPGNPQQEMEVMRAAVEETEQGQVMDSHGETTVWCKACSAYICKASELKRKGDNGHLTCNNHDFATRVEETELANPQCNGSIEPIGIICCRAEGCDELFGIKVRFLNLDPPFGYALNVEKFKTQKDGVTRCPRDWNQVLLDTST